MLQTEFISYLDKFNVVKFTGIEDFSDKFNFLYSVGVFFICTFIVGFKQFFSKPISCYIPVAPSGEEFDDYLESYCWVHGTIPMLPTDRMPHNQEEWDNIDKNRLNYYQWVPFVLAIQGLLFYAPCLLWRMLSNNESGTDLENIVKKAREAVSKMDLEDRNKTLDEIAVDLEDMIFQHRDFRRGKVANFRRRVYNKCSFFMISKRFGNWLFILYVIVKLLYLLNAYGQLFLIHRFLGSNETMVAFGVHITKNLLKGKDWQQTLIFPRVTFCNAKGIRHMGSSNNYIAQCALPVNMINEKIYVFLWFWTLVAAILTTLSIPKWIYQVGLLRSRVKFVKKYLRVSSDYSSSKESELLQGFINHFLRHDGIFILRILSTNAGDIVTSRIIQKLWEKFKEKYSTKNLNNDPRKSIVSFDRKLSLAIRSPNHVSDNTYESAN